MKNKLVLVFFFLASFSLLSAQVKEKQAYMFENFEKGKAILKDGTVSSSLFNYDLIDGKIQFMEDNEIMNLIDPESVQAINIGKRFFVHIRQDTFYEKIPVDGLDFYIDWKSIRGSGAKSSGYGMSQTSAATDVSQTNFDGNVITMSTSNQTYISKNTYYLQIDNKFKKIDSANSLAKLFKGYEEEIKNELNNQKPNFRNLEDVKKAVSYCASIVK